ncbi:MAG: M48 family metallopeptidase [Bdellovibrio sp.]|nr:M48 family metallopeptidase [Bdellovibrio sp.]
MKNIKLLFVLLLTFITLVACSTSTEAGAVGVNRRQLLAVPASQVNEVAAQSYEQVKKEAAAKKTLDTNAAYYQRVKAVADRLIPQVQVFRKDSAQWPWEVHVITSPEVNAYCMPGGKIAFYSGIIEKLNMTDDEIAAVMGHEMAHALREHGRERASQAMIEQGVLALGVATGKLDPKYAQIASLISAGLFVLPNSRGQESEADHIGIELMARAGYNPRSAISLWQKMAAQGGSKPPQFMSTHPSDETRIAQIQEWLPQVTPLYEASVKR